MKNNLSDISIGNYFPHINSPYVVPVPFIPVTLDFVAGYDHGKYINRQRNLVGTFLGVLENLYAFQYQVYLTAFGLVTVCLILIFLQVILIEKYKFRRKRRNRRKKFCLWTNFNLTLADVMYHPSSTRNRITCFIFEVAFFLILTPFGLMFKTTQVVTEKPQVITNYEEIINSRAEVLYTNLNSDEREFLRPGEINVKNNDVVNRMWKYFERKGVLFKAKARMDIIKLRNERTYSLANGSLVFLATRNFAKYLRETHCSWTKDGTILRMFRFHDESQRQILAGNAFRLGYKNDKLVRKFKILFEHRVNWARERRKFRFLGFEKKFVSSNKTIVYNTPRRHRSKQLDVCLDESIGEFHKEETFASDLKFYRLFTVIICLMVLMSVVVFVIEVCKISSKVIS